MAQGNADVGRVDEWEMGAELRVQRKVDGAKILLYQIEPDTIIITQCEYTVCRVSSCNPVLFIVVGCKRVSKDVEG